jgi:regulator of sigma E protease
MSDTAKSPMRLVNGVFWAAVLGVVIYFIARNIGVVGNVVIVLLGFGTVVLVHEFGHFIVAKLSGIKVEAFSIFMPPTILGIRKTKSGFKFRVLPSFTSGRGEEPEEPPEETEYRIGVFPFGGYVKLLGQEDTGPVKQVDDPRSFAHKPIGTRIAVISAGVTFNVVSAALIFMVVFLVGIELAPPVVGGVVPNSPAAKAGLKAGDEVVEIDGLHKDLDFSSILIASALSDAGEPVPVVVRHQDGTIEKRQLVAKEAPGSGTSLREFGILQPLSLTIAQVAQPEMLQERTGLRPGDRVVAADGTEVSHSWELERVVRQTFTPKIKVTIERQTDGGAEKVQTELPLDWGAAKNGEIETNADLNQVCSMIPRLRVAGVDDKRTPAAILIKDQDATDQAQRLQPGDIILAAADVQNPTYKELRDITIKYEDKSLPLTVLRADANGVEQSVAVTVTPKREHGSSRVVIGFVPALDAEHAIVADAVPAQAGTPAIEIPRGARIVSVNDKPVSSFYDIIREVRQWGNQPVTLHYQLDGQTEGGVTLQPAQQSITVESVLAESVPLKPLEKLYQAKGPFDALGMGYRRTVMFIAQTYVTLKQLITGLISPKYLMGPVGIITFSYQIVREQPLVNYAYFLGLISATIAVLNFLPIPPFDGGLVVLMIIEKIRGTALSERAQGVVAYAGWAMILALLVYVTFNDIVRTFFS